MLGTYTVNLKDLMKYALDITMKVLSRIICNNPKPKIEMVHIVIRNKEYFAYWFEELTGT